MDRACVQPLAKRGSDEQVFGADEQAKTTKKWQRLSPRCSMGISCN
jgi:hypothetical protein